MSISLNGFAEESITLKMAGTAAKGTPVSISASLTAAPSQADGVFAGLLTASPKGRLCGRAGQGLCENALQRHSTRARLHRPRRGWKRRCESRLQRPPAPCAGTGYHKENRWILPIKRKGA